MNPPLRAALAAFASILLCCGSPLAQIDRISNQDTNAGLKAALEKGSVAAVPEAKTLLVDAVRKMTLQDAKGILTGGNTAGTEYFKRATAEPLRGKFLPIVQQATRKVRLAEKYNEYAAKGAKFGLVKKEDANLDGYVTQRALDGLFYMVAEEEKKIRENPVKAGSENLRKVFGVLK